MNLEDQCRLSYYKQIAALSDEHCVYLVQHVENKHVYVKKILNVYNLEVFHYLKYHHIKNTPWIYEVVEDENKLIVIEEYISGMTLQEQLDRNGVFPETAVINMIRQLCMILKQLHQSKPPIIHRDIKPSNIIISSDGILKLLDMNAAKRSRDGIGKDTVLIGTVGYAAPEQYGFGMSSVQTDIYAVGILMNMLLSGRFRQEYITEGRLKHIIYRCTRLEPRERYQCIDELLQDLDRIDGRTNTKNTAANNNLDASAASDSSTGRNMPEKSARYYAPPGFRSLKPWKMILATLYYLFILYLGVTFEVKGESNILVIWINRIMIMAVYILEALFFCDYLDIQRKFGISKMKNGLLRWGARLVVGFVIMVVVILLMGILLSFFV